MSQFADRIRKAAQEKSTTAFKPTGSSITAQIQAQQTGKAAPAGPTGQSNIGAQVAASAPNPLGQQAQQAGEQMAQQEQQAATAQMARNAQADMERKQLESQQMLKNNEILNNAIASDKSLDQREDAAELEQAAFALRLQDQEYNSKLDRIAREQGLEDELNFRETVNKEMLGHNLEQVMRDMNFNERQQEMGRAVTWENALADLAHAESIMNAQAQDAQKSAVIGGFMDFAKAGASQYIDSKKEGK